MDATSSSAPVTAPACTIVVDGVHPPSANALLRMTWQQRRRLMRPLVDLVYLQARAQRPPQPYQRIRLVATFTYAGSRPQMRDDDSCVTSLKALIDCLVRGAIVVDDAPGCVHLEVVQVIGERRGLTLEVWPADGDGEDVPARG